MEASKKFVLLRELKALKRPFKFTEASDMYLDICKRRGGLTRYQEWNGRRAVDLYISRILKSSCKRIVTIRGDGKKMPSWVFPEEQELSPPPPIVKGIVAESYEAVKTSDRIHDINMHLLDHDYEKYKPDPSEALEVVKQEKTVVTYYCPHCNGRIKI